MRENEKIKQMSHARDAFGFWKIDKPHRIDPPQTPSDFEKLPFLNDEEKALGAAMLKKFLGEMSGWGLGKGELPAQERIYFQSSIGGLCVDPMSYEAYFKFYERLVCLLTGLDNNDEIMQATTHKKGIDATAKRNDPEVRRRLRNALLICFGIATERNEKFWIRMMATTSTQTEPDDTGSYLMSAEKAAMLSHPESSVWTDEEGLVLQFTFAVIRSEMTDALWDRCMALWGEKETIRYMLWIGHYVSMMMCMNTLTRRKEW
ncbi:MAG: hypothetical protein HKP58_02255 [Desulfatitalea sp.]|nr:hypothetical protein [Desulfatitalea sp.]NNJ99211.1 hypothetical protein [Desulfatitalea sp.]